MRSLNPKGHLTRVCPLVSLERLFPGKHTIADVTANAAGRSFPLAYELSDRLSPRASSSDSVLTAKDTHRVQAGDQSIRGFLAVREKRIRFR